MRRLFILLSFFLSSQIAHASSSFTSLAWHQTKSIYTLIQHHPFNVELAHGILPKEKYVHYLSQDSLYLDHYAKTLSILASKLDNPDDILIVNQFVASTLKEKDPEEHIEKPTRATLNYIHFLNQVGRTGSAAEISAAVLPCFWIYNRVALDLRALSPVNNPYQFWLDQYSTEKFRLEVEFMKELANRLFLKSSPEIRKKMIDAYERASKLELGFWQSAYLNENARYDYTFNTKRNFFYHSKFSIKRKSISPS